MTLEAAVTEESAAPAPAARQWTRARIAGYLFMAIWIGAGIWLIWYLVTAYTPEFADRYAMKFLQGLWVTVQIVSISLVIGAVLSLPLALGRMSNQRSIARLSFGYSYFFRGTPLLAQTFLVYYGLGSFNKELDAIGLWWFFRDAYNCIIFVFALNTAAYQAEILRGAIENVPRGQVEAGRALGLSTWAIYRKVVIPQALITALRPYGNEIILMIKGSAIASLVTVFDLMGETRRAYSRSFDFQTYVWAAILYLAIVETLRNIWNRLDARLTRHLQRTHD